MSGRVAYLTMDDMSAFVSDADMSVVALEALGWDVDWVSWRRADTDWDAYTLVYICTPWDYQDDSAAFIALLERIEASAAKLVNPLAIVHWNLSKDYLRELGASGVATVPSLWFEDFDAVAIEQAFTTFGSDRLVIKPSVGANADDTYPLTEPLSEALEAELAQRFSNRAHFVQPFLESIATEGEYSLFFFGGAYSHAIRKLPAAGDFRSQEEHGAEISPTAPPPGLADTAAQILDRVKPAPVYARADFVRGADGQYLLMELELIEPSLYFRADDESAARFARALDAYARAGSR